MVLKIFEMIATSGLLAALECTKFVFGRDSAAGPTGGAYSAPPDTLAGSRYTGNIDKHAHHTKECSTLPRASPATHVNTIVD